LDMRKTNSYKGKIKGKLFILSKITKKCIK
jgi:hypothetical protein